MRISKKQLRRLIKESLLEQASWRDSNNVRRPINRDPTEGLAKLHQAVQEIVDSGSSAIMDMDEKIAAYGFNTDYMSGMGMRYVEVEIAGNTFVVISKNMVEPDPDTKIIGPYAVGKLS